MNLVVADCVVAFFGIGPGEVSMSDEFDREAERERLREKYERDKQKREASERMSELLLQGATMTNHHCPECHSPVFRYDGSEFCPTCEREVTREEATDEPVGSNGDGEAAESTGDSASAENESGSPETDEIRETDTESETLATEDPASVAEESTTASETVADESLPTPSPERAPRRRRSDGDVDDVEASLIRTLEALTARAEDTSDVGRQRQLLAAAREAAETLEALRRV